MGSSVAVVQAHAAIGFAHQHFAQLGVVFAYDRINCCLGIFHDPTHTLVASAEPFPVSQPGIDRGADHIGR